MTSEAPTPLIPLEEVRPLAEDLDHPECVALGPDGALYAGGEAGQIWRIDPGNGCEQIAQLAGAFLLGVALDAAGRIYACDMNGRKLLRHDPGSGDTVTYCDGADGGALVCPNYALLEPDGSLWLTDSGTDRGSCDGALLRIAPDGEAQRIELPLDFPNGLARVADGMLLIAESFSPAVRTWRDGELGTLVELPGTVPDGLAVCADGGVLVGCFAPNRVLRIPPDGGEPQVVLDDWTGQRLITPTNIAFFGPELESFAIAGLCGWWVLAVESPWAGRDVLVAS